MNEELEEILFDLLTKQATYGLDAAEQKQLEELSANANFRIDDSFDIAAAAIGLADLDIEPMPEHLNSKILALADNYFAADEPAAGSVVESAEDSATDDMQPTFGFEPKRSGIGSWLGWVLAGAACIALAFNIYTTRFQGPTEVGKGPIPTETPGKPDPAKQFDEMMAASGMIKAVWSPGPKAPEMAQVKGDIVWDDAKQVGYMKFRGLPANDKAKTTYQLWIFEENMGSDTPVDGGTFDVDSNGDIVIPINAKYKTKNPAMFAVTIEKPGGVVVSERGAKSPDRGKIAALAKVVKTET